ncbi:MAG: BMP family protein [Caldilineaceae bacterium]|nr:BMP family protein [Caldilineaceae bacterium]
MQRQSFKVLYLLLVGILLLTACVQPTAPAATPASSEETTSTESSEPSVALVLIGPKDDNSWAESAYNALQAEADKGIKTAFSESVSDADVARVMREYVDQGFSIIVAHSFSYQDAVFEVAAEAPEVNFAWAGALGRTATNVADYDQPFHEPAYLVGILAGYVSESGSLGALYGFDIPACHSMGEAFIAGAKTVNPDATLTYTAVGDWGDVAAAKEAALAQVDTAGVDYWIGCGEGPTLGSIEAAKETGGYTTGYVGDMSELGPDVVLSSIVWDMGQIFDAMVTETADGSFDAPYYQFGVAAGALDIVLNPALAEQVPADALTAIDAARASIKDGSFEVPFIPE